MAEFYCEKIESYTEINDCEICEKFENCKKNGYLSDIVEKHGFEPTDKYAQPFQRLARRVQRALNHKYLKGLCEDSDLKENAHKSNPKLNAYKSRISGCTDSRKFSLKKKDLKAICNSLGKDCSPDLRNALNEAAKSYLGTKGIWEGKPSLSELKKDLEAVGKMANKLCNKLDNLQPEIRGHLQLSCGGLLSIYRLQRAAEDMQAGNRNLANLPLILLIKELASIYHDITGRKPTATCYDSKDKDKDTKISQFLDFTFLFLKSVDPKAI